MPEFQDDSTDCAICLEPLFHDESPSQRVLTLQCGHKWHFDCLVQQLQTAQSMMTSRGNNQRLIFTGCQCAKCGQICEHDELDHLTRVTDALRVKVDALLEEQLQLDAPDVWKKVIAETEYSTQQDEDYRGINPQSPKDMLLNEARRKYAFYLCSHCKEPYFGGTIACADDLLLEDSSQKPVEQRLCTACAPQSQIVCRNPQEHGRYLVWKCRYCCQPSTHVCYGNVHFCDDCHKRNSMRVRELQQQQQHRQQRLKNNRVINPPPLEPLPCPGESCCFPKPNRNTIYHCNGSSPVDCEQVYSCAFCESNADRRRPYYEPGSHNLLVNPSGELGLEGWQQLNGRMSWVVEESELPVNATATTNFVSSFMECVMVQKLNLFQVLTPPLNWIGPVRIEVSARYMGRTDCPSVFRMESILSSARRNGLDDSRTLQVISRQSTPTLEAPPDYWESARLEVVLDPHRLPILLSNQFNLILQVVVMGRDRRFWQGRFGSKVADISVRILGSDEELNANCLPFSRTRRTINNSDDEARGHHTINPQGQSQGVHRTHHHAPSAGNVNNSHSQNANSRMLWDFFLPAICFAFLAWLAMDGRSYSDTVLI